MHKVVKISEFIKTLLETVAEHGDLQILVHREETTYDADAEIGVVVTRAAPDKLDATRFTTGLHSNCEESCSYGCRKVAIVDLVLI